MGMIGKLASVALLALALEGCAVSSNDVDYAQAPMPPARTPALMENDNPAPLQCVPYAREHSGIRIFGDAYTWWDKAAGKYPRGALPEPGAVMVLNNYAGPTHGHVAVVRQVMSAREIRVDHANWLNDGAIYVDDPVEDISSNNDWSVVRVYNLRTGGWGARRYPVQGFIGGSDLDRPDLVAQSGGGMGATALIGKIN